MCNNAKTIMDSVISKFTADNENGLLVLVPNFRFFFISVGHLNKAQFSKILRKQQNVLIFFLRSVVNNETTLRAK